MGSVVVVGGGVAGLTCAWKLRRAGHEVEVLEREAEAGGRMRSEHHSGFRVDRGAQFVASAYRNLHATAEALGLRHRLRRVPDAKTAVLRDGGLHPADVDRPLALLRTGLLSSTAKRRLLRLPLELLRRRQVLDPWRPERAAALDSRDLADGLRRLVGEEALEWLLAPAFSSTFDSDPESLSEAFALLATRLVAGGFELQTFDDGPGLLTRTLAEAVPVRTGCEVTSVETEPQGARVRYRTQGRERRVVADAAVVALPGSLVAGVCPKLTPEERGFFESVRYARGMIVHLLLDAPPPPLGDLFGVAFPRREGIDLYGLAVDHGKPGAAPGGGGLVNVALTEAAADRLRDASDDAVAQHALDELAKTPVGRLAPVASIVHRWDAMLPQFFAGYLPRLARFGARIDRSPRLAFAGDYLLGPYTEMAVTSGMRAATEVARSLERAR